MVPYQKITEAFYWFERKKFNICYEKIDFSAFFLLRKPMHLFQTYTIRIEYISWTRIYQYLFKHFRPPKGCVGFAKSQWQHEILISLFTGFLVHWKDISQLTQCLTQCFACYDNSFWDLLWKRIFSMKTNWNGALAQIKEIEQNCVKLIF